MRNMLLANVLVLFSFVLVNAQTTKRIKLTVCGDALTVVGNLTKNGKSFLYLVKLTKGEKLQLNLSAKPNYKDIGVNLYHDNDSYDSKYPILQGEVGSDYEFVIKETGNYSIMVYANRKTTRFSLSLDIDDKGWKC